MTATDSHPAPAEFLAAIASLDAAKLRPEVQVEEAPAPTRLAPHAVALRTTVATGAEDLASGRIVVLYDPNGNEAWDGRFRVVAFLEAGLEPELALDPLLPDVGWAWLKEALGDLPHHNLGGTVTRVASQSFGALAERPVEGTVQVRASWTPDGPLGDHLVAFADLMCTVAGLPPLPPGVAPMVRRR